MCSVQHRESRIVMWGKDITQASSHQRHRLGLGFLLQSRNVFTRLTVRENFDIANVNAPVGGNAVCTRIMGSALELELDTRAGLLSGGQRQLLALGMVLAQSPSVLLLDEPTAGLSGDNALILVRALEELAAHEPRTVMLIVEHNTDPLKNLATRVLALRSGEQVLGIQSQEDLLNGDKMLHAYGDT